MRNKRYTFNQFLGGVYPDDFYGDSIDEDEHSQTYRTSNGSTNDHISIEEMLENLRKMAEEAASSYKSFRGNFWDMGSRHDQIAGQVLLKNFVAFTQEKGFFPQAWKEAIYQYNQRTKNAYADKERRLGLNPNIRILIMRALIDEYKLQAGLIEKAQFQGVSL